MDKKRRLLFNFDIFIIIDLIATRELIMLRNLFYSISDTGNVRVANLL